MSKYVSLLDASLRRVCGERGARPRLPGNDQILANALGIDLALTWAHVGARGPRSNFHVYATSHVMPSGRSRFTLLPVAFRRQLASRLHDQEFLTDIFVTRRSKIGSRMVETPLVAVEVEAHASQTVAYDYEEKGYLWDFSKLLYVRAERRLFIGQVPASRVDALCKVLSLGFRDAPRDEDAVTWAVVLPTANRDFSEIRSAVSLGSTSLRFERPFASARLGAGAGAA